MENRGKTKREAPISYRPPKGLRDEFAQRVERSGLSINAYITKAIFAEAAPRSRRQPSERELDMTRILAPGADIQAFFAFVEKHCTEDPEIITEIEKARDALSEIRSAVFRANRRQP